MVQAASMLRPTEDHSIHKCNYILKLQAFHPRLSPTCTSYIITSGFLLFPGIRANLRSINKRRYIYVLCMVAMDDPLGHASSRTPPSFMTVRQLPRSDLPR